MAILVVLLALGSMLWGAASYLSPSALGIGAAVVGTWLLGFVVRERIRIARTRKAASE
ncbi:hypothetical protein [Phaeacidiphilus oryzae]|jgi:hypothetical protein|uniref:hypothetical protein n=1 Tax=Phaeacidiphilus oryzae TaxID=348818 RepID=UPI000AE5867D|nr:hypothetical protein [Phaeacidiphilus oryzae]